ISFESFIAQTAASDEEMKKYYNQNLQEFQIREQAKVEYVKFSIDGMLSTVSVDDEESRKYHDEHQAEFGTPEERKVSHILITAAANANQSETKIAQNKAENILQQLHANPGKFAELAKRYSEDTGSAPNGGDLGFFRRGAMVKQFEDAAFELKPGEISGLVKTDFGFHIIKLNEIKPSKNLSYEKVKEDIVGKLRLQKAAKKFAELAEQFSNTVYEQSDTLKPAAELAGTKIEQAGWLFNGTETGDIWTTKMLQAIFNDEVIKNKRNTAAIEVASNTLVAARVIDYKPSAVREFGEVRETISGKLKLKLAKELASKRGTELLSRLKNGEKATIDWGPAQNITRAKYGSLNADLVKKVFQTASDRLPQFIGVDDERKGYLLARIDAVKDGDPTGENKRPQYVQQLQQLTGEEMLRAYLATAKDGASITLNMSDISAKPQ
ncbi:MAG: peptidylprolyl isomerase, partial [Gallionella sp.]